MSTVRRILKKRTTLTAPQIQRILDDLYADWSPQMAQYVEDDHSATLLSRFLGLRDWTDPTSLPEDPNVPPAP